MYGVYPGLAAGVFILLSRGHFCVVLEGTWVSQMIPLTRLNGKRFVVNAEQIRYVETTPDTMITLMNGDKVMVKEALDEVVRLAVEYGRQLRSILV